MNKTEAYIAPPVICHPALLFPTITVEAKCLQTTFSQLQNRLDGEQRGALAEDFDNRFFILQALLPGTSLKSPVIGRELARMAIC